MKDMIQFYCLRFDGKKTFRQLHFARYCDVSFIKFDADSGFFNISVFTHDDKTELFTNVVSIDLF